MGHSHSKCADMHFCNHRAPQTGHFNPTYPDADWSGCVLECYEPEKCFNIPSGGIPLIAIATSSKDVSCSLYEGDNCGGTYIGETFSEAYLNDQLRGKAHSVKCHNRS